MKYFCCAVMFLVSCVSFFSCLALDLVNAARDTVHGAAQVTEDTLRSPSNVVEGAANVTNDSLETTGNVVEDLVVPRNRRVVISHEEMNEQELPYMPEYDEAYIPE
jgi:hypothetical protein